MPAPKKKLEFPDSGIVQTSAAAAASIRSSKEASADKKLYLPTGVDYSKDIKWMDENVAPGLLTWVQTIDPALFLSYMSLWSLSTNESVTKLPILQSYLGQKYEKTSPSMHTVLFTMEKNTKGEISLFKASVGASEPAQLTTFRKVIDDRILPPLESAADGSTIKNTPVYIFQIRHLDETLKYFITDLQEIYYRFWGSIDSNPSKFRVLPAGFPKIIFVPITDMAFPTYMKRKVLYVNFDQWSPKSEFCRQFRRLSLLSESSEKRIEKIPFPTTLLEQTASFCASSNDVSDLIKTSLIESSPGLRSINNPPNMDAIAGYEKIKEWAREVKAFMDSEFYKESERPRGLLTVGMPGTGKTTFAKAIASVFQWPLIEMDIAQMKAAVQGATEQNMLNATSTVMTINRCIMLIDEVEKALGGVESSNSTDGGTLMGIFNRLLQFMEDDSHSAVVMMTANGFKDIPPALMRSGRIDLVVYAALPSIKTRESIFKIHLAKTAFPTELEPEHIKQLALKTGDYSGAEIESAIYHSKWNLAASGKLKNVKPEELYSTILRKIGEIKPVARSRADDLKALKDWAEVYALSTEE